jgi:superfamily I DNA and/or RNA helicase
LHEHNRNDAQRYEPSLRASRNSQEGVSEVERGFPPASLQGIRDYAEYIPLEEGMFDLVIIDEASQVSVAQAFPALIRAKKVLILGDKKQFSNIKGPGSF